MTTVEQQGTCHPSFLPSGYYGRLRTRTSNLEFVSAVNLKANMTHMEVIILSKYVDGEKLYQEKLIYLKKKNNFFSHHT